jgi:hypothetical protein
MKLIFTEAKSDFHNYIYPYNILAIPDKGEPPSALINRGFLVSPSSRKTAKYTLVRSIRIRLENFTIHSKNRRVIRKNEGITCELIPRQNFSYSPAWQDLCKTFADARFGSNIMSTERLSRIFTSEFLTHLMVFTDTATNRAVGILLLYVEEPIVYCLLPFYDLAYMEHHLGMYQAVKAVQHFADQGYTFFYFGSGYGDKALYKTQFRGTEFFSGHSWSDDLAELKQRIAWDEGRSPSPIDDSQITGDEALVMKVKLEKSHDH